MVLERLKLPEFLLVWDEHFLHTSMGVGRGAAIWTFQQKKAVFLVSSGINTNFTTSGPQPRNTFGKIHQSPRQEKFLPTSMHTSMENYVIFVAYVMQLCL